MLKNFFILLAFTGVYIFLLTVLFENFVNRPSSTWLTLLGVLLFFMISYLFATALIKTYKNRLK
jgi:cytochrome c oxidase assembly factor CtaG